MRYADALNRLSSLYIAVQLDSSGKYAKEAQLLSDRIHYPKGLADAYMNLGTCFTFLTAGWPIVFTWKRCNVSKACVTPQVFARPLITLALIIIMKGVRR
jgi:hypothetical protein